MIRKMINKIKNNLVVNIISKTLSPINLSATQIIFDK